MPLMLSTDTLQYIEHAQLDMHVDVRLGLACRLEHRQMTITYGTNIRHDAAVRSVRTLHHTSGSMLL